MGKQTAPEKSVGIIGCGWLGGRLAQHLSEEGYVLHTTTTSTEKLEQMEKAGWNPTVARFSDTEASTENPWPVAANLDAIVISTPFSRKSQPSALGMRAGDLIRFTGDYQKPVFLFSSTGIYPNVPEVITEDSAAEADLHPSLLTVEKMLSEQYPQLIILRLAGLMGDDRYFSKYFTDRALPDPDQPVNHIHYADICQIVALLLHHPPLGETFNLVAPLHPSKQEVLSAQTGKTSNHPIKDAPGRIISSEKISRFLQYDFRFKDPRFFV